MLRRSLQASLAANFAGRMAKLARNIVVRDQTEATDAKIGKGLRAGRKRLVWRMEHLTWRPAVGDRLAKDGPWW